MNWQRGRSYGQDRRGKMFVAIDRGVEPKAVATAFSVSVSWIYKLGGPATRPQRYHVPGKPDRHHEAIRARVAALPDMTIAELRGWDAGNPRCHGQPCGDVETLRRLKLTLERIPVMPQKQAVRSRWSEVILFMGSALLLPGWPRARRRSA